MLPPNWSSVKVYFGVVTILAFWTGPAWPGWCGGSFEPAGKGVCGSGPGPGRGDRSIIFRHILPNIVSYLVVTATLSFPGMIMGESTISFLGLGIKEPMTSWGCFCGMPRAWM